MKCIKIGMGLILSLLYLGCSHYESNDVLLQAGNYKLTVADYEYFKTRQKEKPVNSGIRDQREENAYILAYAIENRFDTIRVLAKKLNNAERLYTSDVDGYVWNKKVKPLLKVSSGEIEEAYEKRKTRYTIEYIYFPDSISLNKYVAPGSLNKSAKSFDMLKQQILSSPEVKHSMFQGTYPFYPFGVYTNRIIDAQKGDVWGPFEALEGYYVVQVTGKETVVQRSLTEEKAGIEKELLNALKLKFIWESQREVLGGMSPAMHDSAISLMAGKYIAGKKEWPGIDGRIILMDYRFKGKNFHYTANDFMDFVRYQPMYIGSPGNAGDMKKMMTNFLMEVWYYNEALNMGAATDQEFLCFKKHYQSKLFVSYYNEINIYPNIRLSPDEIRTYYDNNHDKLQHPETATLSIYKFGNQQAAFKAMMPLTRYYENILKRGAADTLPKLQGVSSIQKDVKFQISDTANNAMLVNAILGGDTGRVLSPREINGEYWIVYLAGKEGKTLLPYKYARGELQQMLLAKKMQDVSDRLLAGLKAQYPLKVDRLREYKSKNK